MTLLLALKLAALAMVLVSALGWLWLVVTIVRERPNQAPKLAHTTGAPLRRNTHPRKRVF